MLLRMLIRQRLATSVHNVVVTADDEVRYEAVFRERWRDRKSEGARTGELIRQPGRIDVGLVALGILLASGAVAAGTMTTARTEALPAVLQGTSVSAVPASAPPPAPGTAVGGVVSVCQNVIGREPAISHPSCGRGRGPVGGGPAGPVSWGVVQRTGLSAAEAALWWLAPQRCSSRPVWVLVAASVRPPGRLR